METYALVCLGCWKLILHRERIDTSNADNVNNNGLLKLRFENVVFLSHLKLLKHVDDNTIHR